MTNHDREEGHVTTSPGNGAPALRDAVPVTVTVPRSPGSPVTDTPADGHVPGNGTAGHGNVPVTDDGSKVRFSIFRRPAADGNGNGHGHEERSPVPVSAVPEPICQGDAEAVTEAPEPAAKVKKTLNWRLVGLWFAIILMTAMTTLLASSGQIDGTWKWAGLVTTDPRRFLLPGSTEFAVIGFLLMGQHALSKEQSPFVWWRFAALFAVLAVLMNSVHGDPGHKIPQALIFGGASAASLVMWFAKFWIDYLDYRKKQGHIAGLRPKVWTLGAVRYVPLAWRADLIVSRCDQVATRADAYRLAELWRMVYQDVRAQDGADSKIAKRTAWYTVYRELGIKVIQPKGLTIAAVDFAPPPPPPALPAPPQVRRPPAPTPPSNGGDQNLPTLSPADKPKITPANPVPEHLWADHDEDIKKFQSAVPDWATRDKVTVNDVQAVIRNRTNAANTAACIRVLRARAAAGSN